MVFGLKRPSMSVQNLFFARPAPIKPSPPLFSITGCDNRHPDVLPAPFFAIFHTSNLLSLPKNEIRAGKQLVDPGHPKEELVGGRPHHLYKKARRRRPRVGRALHILLITMPKNYLKQVSL